MSENRYHRQMILPQIGPAGQQKLGAARVLLVGCGALGSVIAEQLVRAGIGWIRIADRDVVEWSNLQRQVLFDESDARVGIPKAQAAARRLREINSSVTIEPAIVDVHSGNIEDLIRSDDRPIDLLLDGTDNAETRYLLNDAAVKHSIPWVYGACVGTEGRVMLIRPGKTPCLRCIFEQPPSAGELPTCDTAGVLAPPAAIVASLQVTAAIRYLVAGSHISNMLAFDVWSSKFQSINTENARREDCVCCGQRKFEFLDRPAGDAVTLCGRNASQIRPGRNTSLDLTKIAAKLATVGRVEAQQFLVRCQLNEGKPLRMTIFQDGRAIIEGETDFARARSLYSRYVGS